MLHLGINKFGKDILLCKLLIIVKRVDHRITIEDRLAIRKKLNKINNPQKPLKNRKFFSAPKKEGKILLKCKLL